MNNNLAKTVLNIALFSILIANTDYVFSQISIELLPTGDNDLQATVLQSTETRQLFNRSRDDVSISWALQPTQGLSETSNPYTASSKEYWSSIDGASLQQGVKIQTTAPGAIVKISPRPDSAIPTNTLPALNANQLIIIDAQGKQYSYLSALVKSVTATQLESTQLAFLPGTILFQLDETLGYGEFTIKHRNTVNERQAYFLHVLDKNSDYRLSVKTGDDTVFAGQPLTGQVALTHNKAIQNIDNLKIYLRSPNGEKLVVDHNITKTGAFEAREISDNVEDSDIGLWELHVIAKSMLNGMTVQRNAKTTFSYSKPNAALLNTVNVSRGKEPNDTLALTFGINAVSSGRFELRGTLFGTDDTGKQVPMMFANSAGWRAAGTSTLDLSFDLTKVSDSGLQGPFELRDLRLLDQSRMMLLHRQRRALSFQ